MSKLENKIIECCDLDKRIKTLEDAFKELKKELIVCYFDDNPVYIDKQGRTLITYKGHEQEYFMKSEFTKEHPKIAKEFTVEKLVKRFIPH